MHNVGVFITTVQSIGWNLRYAEIASNPRQIVRAAVHRCLARKCLNRPGYHGQMYWPNRSCLQYSGYAKFARVRKHYL